MRRENSVVARLLDLPGVWVVGVSFGQRDVSVDVRLRRRRLACPYCGYVSWFRHETRPVDSTWVHLDLGRRGCVVRARLRRLACPRHGVVVEAVPFARPPARFTRDFEDLVAWLVTKMDKTAVCRLARIDWKTVGRICARVVADGLDPTRLDRLVRIGVDEVAWRRGHSYLTLVADHARGKIVWGTHGREAAALDGLFAELGEQRSGGIEAVSMDLAPAYAKSVAEHAPQARICADPFHVVKLATDALNTLRRQVWQDMPKTDPVKAKTFKGARWALLKNPTDLTDEQAATLRRLRRRGGDFGAATGSRNHYAPSSPATWASTRSGSCSTGGSPKRNALAWHRSSRPPRPSASIVTGSWPRSGWASTTAAPRA